MTRLLAPATQLHRAVCARAARAAVHSLYAELTLYPKPGLVSLIDNGSHADMNAETFFRSLFALRHYFARICQAGIDDAPFAVLKQLGIGAETAMLRATAGINTHRGAIFSLGLLCAAYGRSWARGQTPTPATLRASLLHAWGNGLAGHTEASAGLSHGAQAAMHYCAGGAREEAALGLPSVFNIALPAMRQTLAQGRSMVQARVDGLFALMQQMSDTNILHRGGAAGAQLVRAHSAAFMAQGGTANQDWMAHALDCHRVFVAHRLSPGGAADLLAATCLVLALTDQA